jgi:hypothetical protein
MEAPLLSSGISKPPNFTAFLVSPANLNGERARMILRSEAAFPLARELHSREGAQLVDVFSFISGLYFRGKAVYASAFGSLPNGHTGGLVITPAEGLAFFNERVTAERLSSWAQVPVSSQNPTFTEPLIGHCHELLRVLGEDARYVLLGSVATDKYVAPLTRVLHDRLLFPERFAGLGDMSRGALLLRAARDGEELAYAPVTTLRRQPRS